MILKCLLAACLGFFLNDIFKFIVKHGLIGTIQIVIYIILALSILLTFYIYNKPNLFRIVKYEAVRDLFRNFVPNLIKPYIRPYIYNPRRISLRALDRNK